MEKLFIRFDMRKHNCENIYENIVELIYDNNI